MQTPEDYSIESQAVDTIQPPVLPPQPVAPLWHALVLIAAVVALSIQGVREFSGKQVEPDRIVTYTSTAISELLMVGWVFLGLRLRKIPFRSLFGTVSGGFRTLAVDLGSAMVFWIVSLMVLGTIGIVWSVTEALIKHRPLLHTGKQITPDPSQQQALHALTSLVPTNWHEIVAWVLLCIVAGFTEETIFRGYFQRQFIAWSRGSIVAGVAFSALLFGSAHGYQGIRNMVMLSVFGALFSLLSLIRRNIRAGIIAHTWHDLIAGLTLAFLKMHHLI